MSRQNESSGPTEIPVTSITIYGGKTEEVGIDAKRILGIAEDEYYGTWLSMGVMRRLGFLFEGGVESAGGLAEIVCVFALIIIFLAMFAFWSVAVVFVAVIVLTILSGGAAYKFLRAVYITAPISSMQNSTIDVFVSDQLTKGRFVRIEDKNISSNLSEVSKRSSTASNAFRRGIQFALLIATIFLITEVVYFILNQHWLSGLTPATADFEILVLGIFGLLFLLGVIIMDIGVYLRRSTAKKLE